MRLSLVIGGRVVDEVKNRVDKVSVMIFMKKGSKVLIASGSKNSPIKAGDWIKNSSSNCRWWWWWKS